MVEGIKVIVVGCGFAGLACAIETSRKGHKVLLLEKRQSIDKLGDVISFASNTGRLFERWNLGDRLMRVCTQHPEMLIHEHKGNLLNVQKLPQKVFDSNSYNGRRGDIHKILLDYAYDLGVEVQFGTEVEGYWEDEDAKKSGVVVKGERIEGDLVVGADGVRSKARELVLGYHDRPKPSGFAIYRAWFNAEERGIDRDPLTSYLSEKDTFYAWVGEDAHFLAMSFNGGKEICWLLTHQDNQDIGESWSLPGKITDVLSIVDAWDPRCRAIVSKAPFCIDWKLVYRDPLPTWVSSGGRTVVIGDAAHPFLPTSIQGASQGVEDGVVLAVALHLSGKDNIPQATRVFEHLRYERVKKAQELGEATRNKWHLKQDDRDENVELPFPEWLLNFDAEKQAYKDYQSVAEGLANFGYTTPSVRLLYPKSDSL